MSDLPPGWEWTTLGEIADTSLGKMLDRGKSAGHSEVPYLRNLNVQWGRFDLSDVLTMEIPPDERDYYQVKPGDLLVCEGGEIGRCAIWSKEAGYIAFQKALHRVRPFDQIDVRYLRYLLEHLSATESLSALSTGSTIKHLPQLKLRRIRVPLPPAPEQQRIVDALEDHLSRLDAGLGSLNAAARNTERLRAEVLEHETQATTQHYPKMRLGELGSVTTGSTPSTKKSEYFGSGVPFLTPADIGRGARISRATRSLTPAGARAARLLSPGAIVTVCIGATLGKVGWIDRQACANQQINAIEPSMDLADSKYLSYALASRSMQEKLWAEASSTTIPILNKGKFSRIPISIPPVENQRVIVERIESVLNTVERQDNINTLLRQRAVSFRQSLLAEAFSGWLSQQDPTDEPALGLLQRIRAESQNTKRGDHRKRNEPMRESLL